jgi:hypothetical protein
MILLNILHITLACPSSPSSTSMIHRFGLLIESLSFCIFLLQLLSLLPKNSILSLTSILPSSPEIVSSTYSSMLEWLSTAFFIDLRNFLFPGFLFDFFFFFFEVYHSFFELHFHILCCLLYFIYLFFVDSLVSF